MSKIGFIGLGIMGKPMAMNLVKGGTDVMVSDLDPARVDELCKLGASRGSYQEIGEQCEIVLMILPKGAIVQDVLFGSGHLADYLCKGKLVCDMSSVTPLESRFCHEKLMERGIRFMDAPVSGGESGAVAATLAIMCGGDEADFNQLKPYFSLMGESATLMGGPGCGSAVKLANQIIVNLNIATISEALVFVTKAGVPWV